jgi:hypothetical protein
MLVFNDEYIQTLVFGLYQVAMVGLSLCAQLLEYPSFHHTQFVPQLQHVRERLDTDCRCCALSRQIARPGSQPVTVVMWLDLGFF